MDDLIHRLKVLPAQDERGIASVYPMALVKTTHEAADALDRLRGDRDSWRRVCERLETEKQELRAALKTAEKAMLRTISGGNISFRELDVVRAALAK